MNGFDLLIRLLLLSIIIHIVCSFPKIIFTLKKKEYKLALITIPMDFILSATFVAGLICGIKREIDVEFYKYNIERNNFTKNKNRIDIIFAEYSKQKLSKLRRV